MKTETRRGQVFGLSIGELLGTYDRDSQSWKTSQLSLFEDLTLCWDRLPKLNTIVNGKILEHQMWAHLTDVKEFGSLLIPLAQSKGIYLILNKINNKFYVGSTKQNFIRRLKAHIIELEKKIHHCLPLQRAINKYGIHNFIICCIPINENERLLIEQKIINEFSINIYNVCKIAGCPKIILSEEARHKISIRMSNRVISQETKNKISQTLTGRNRGIEFSKKCSERLKGKPLNISKEKMYRGKKVERIDTGEIFNSAVEASRLLGLAENSVSKSIYRKRRTGGSFWKYVK